jgi:formate dehydrogenase major subunit
MLHKRATAKTSFGHLRRALEPEPGNGLNRRVFLRNSGLAAGGIGALSALGPGMVRKAEGDTPYQTGPIEHKKTVCPFCAVGCSIWAEVQNGVWVGQEPVFESPVNMGTHCAKGAATRELAIGERRLKYPMELVGGQ